MKKLNQYVSIINEDMIFTAGKYIADVNIKAGEYYIWGDSIQYYFNMIINSDEVTDGYAELYYGDKLELIKGKMTSVNNIEYNYKDINVISPGHVYRMGKEIPFGMYLFVKKNNDNKPLWEHLISEMHIYSRCNAPAYSVSSEYGGANIDIDRRYVTIKNGEAKYCKYSDFDEYGCIKKYCMSAENVYNRCGIELINNDSIVVRLFKYYACGGRFLSKAVMDVFKYCCYSVNGIVKWLGVIKPFSFHKLQDLEIDFYTNDGLVVHKTLNDFDFLQYGFYVFGEEFNDEKRTRYYITTALPSNFINKNITMVLRKLNDTNVFVRIQDFATETDRNNTHGVRSEFVGEFFELELLLNRFEGINVEQELRKLEKTPDLVPHIISALNESIGFAMSNSPIDERNTNIRFRVPKTYDKKYYCASKLADVAKSIIPISHGTEFLITFSGEQINEIELMYYMYFTYEKKQEMADIEKYVINHSTTFYTIERMQKCISELINNYTCRYEFADSVLDRIIKCEKKKLQKKIDNLYSDIVKENRVPVKWCNEYKLFSLVYLFYPSAVYQYRCDWLGTQSFDIYLDEIKTAIEYQGKQHYEEVDFFGGKEGLINYKNRDKKKRLLSEENGIKLLEWPYTKNICYDSVQDFFIENNIPIKRHVNTNKNWNIMAPYISNEKEKKELKKHYIHPKYYIVQYDMSGEYVSHFISIREAAITVGVSETSISKVICGKRNSSANFIWRRYNFEEEIPQKIEVLFDIEKTNPGVAKRIVQLDNKANEMSEFNSISEAAQVTGISSRHIQRELYKDLSDEWKYL